MPLINLVCPHCESQIEVQVTSVTRSRVCSQCERSIVLQFATRVTGSKRRALLTETLEAGGEEAGVDGMGEVEWVATERMLLDEEVQKRMLHDPEVVESARQLRIGFFVVLGLVGLLVVGHFLQWWPWSGGGEFGAEQVGEGVRGQGKAVVMKGEVVFSGKPKTDEAMARAKLFLEAESLEERLELVRDRKMMEGKMREYYERHESGPIGYEKLSVEPSGDDGPRFAFQVVLSSGEVRRLYGGMPKNGLATMDWASFVVYSEMGWGDYMGERPREPKLFRVLAVRESHFAGDFNNASTLGCVKLSDPLSSDSKPLFAYYDKVSRVGREMEFVLKQSGGQVIPLTLVLRYPADAKAEDQVWVEERVAEGWMARGR